MCQVPSVVRAGWKDDLKVSTEADKSHGSGTSDRLPCQPCQSAHSRQLHARRRNVFHGLFIVAFAGNISRAGARPSLHGQAALRRR